MDKKRDTEDIINRIRNAEDDALKPLTDIVALKISRGPFDRGPEDNIIKAERITAEYISENFNTPEEFQEKLLVMDGGVKGIEKMADTIYQYYKEKDYLDFETVKDNISSEKNIVLKTIADLVAYKLSQSSDDQGPDLNFISAQTFVAEYISMNFRNMEELNSRISKMGKDMKGLNAFADTVYDHFVTRDK